MTIARHVEVTNNHFLGHSDRSLLKLLSFLEATGLNIDTGRISHISLFVNCWLRAFI